MVCYFLFEYDFTFVLRKTPRSTQHCLEKSVTAIICSSWSCSCSVSPAQPSAIESTRAHHQRHRIFQTYCQRPGHECHPCLWRSCIGRLFDPGSSSVGTLKFSKASRNSSKLRSLHKPRHLPQIWHGFTLLHNVLQNEVHCQAWTSRSWDHLALPLEVTAVTTGTAAPGPKGAADIDDFKKITVHTHCKYTAHLIIKGSECILISRLLNKEWDWQNREPPTNSPPAHSQLQTWTAEQLSSLAANWQLQKFLSRASYANTASTQDGILQFAVWGLNLQEACFWTDWPVDCTQSYSHSAPVSVCMQDGRHQTMVAFFPLSPSCSS